MVIEFPSYPKIYRLGHRDIEGILDTDVIVQEKIDGSQINWTWDNDGNLHVKSKGGWQFGGPENRIKPDDLFNRSITTLATIEGAEIYAGLFFRGEAMNSPKHNTLKYERVPAGNIVLFDVLDAGWNPDGYPGNLDATLLEWAGVFGIESVPVYWYGNYQEDGFPEDYLTRESMLGGPIEGYVIKNYDRWTLDKKPMMAKVVREEFVELHTRSWKANNPTKADAVQLIIGLLNTEARFQKAVQHLAEKGELVNAEQDIGKLMVQVKEDVMNEESLWIADKLIEVFLPQIKRGIGRGLPEWYKARLNEGREL